GPLTAPPIVPLARRRRRYAGAALGLVAGLSAWPLAGDVPWFFGLLLCGGLAGLGAAAQALIRWVADELPLPRRRRLELATAARAHLEEDRWGQARPSLEALRGWEALTNLALAAAAQEDFEAADAALAQAAPPARESWRVHLAAAWVHLE